MEMVKKVTEHSVNLILMRGPVKLILSSTSTTPPVKPVRSSFMVDVVEMRTDSLQQKSVGKSVEIKVKL